jgi:transcriptional regulator of arginine metabolism
MTKEKKERLETIGDLITEHKSIGTQQELVELLRQKGYEVTQSAVSRDLAELGIKRVNGRYVLKPWHPVGAADFDGIVGFVQQVGRAGPNLTIITTSPNAAKMVATAIDDAHWPEAMGTVWSDDTIFLATAGQEAQDALFARLRKYLKRGG